MIKKSGRYLLIIIGFLLIVAVFTWRNQQIVFGLANGLTSYQIQKGGDSGRYIQGADRLIKGEGLVGKQRNYIGYIAIVALVKLSGLSFNYLAVVHLVLAIIAGMCVFLMGKAAFGIGAGILATILFFENPDLAIWNGFILTDASYAYLIIISTFVLFKTGESGGLWHGFLWVLILATAFVRPNGWILFPVAGVYLSFVRLEGIIAKLVAVATICLSFLAIASFVPIFNKGIQSESPSKMFSKGVVIWGYSGWDLKMPKLEKADGDWGRGVMMAVKYPVEGAKLALTRIGVELIRVRPYYSKRMNIRLGVEVGVIYFFALIGAAFTRRKDISKLLFMVVMAHLLILAITFASYDGRFLQYFLPLITIWTGVGLSILFQPNYNRLLGEGELS